MVVTVEGPERERAERQIAIVLFLTVLSAYLARVSLSVAVPFIASDFGWSPEQLGSLGGLLLGIFLVGYGFSNVLISPLVDCYGPTKGLLIAVAAWSALTLLTGVVGMFYAVFILLRVSLGLSQGLVFPAAGKITQAWFPPQRRSRMNALYYGAIGLSNMLSPLLLIPLILISSWNIMFVVLALFGFALMVPMAMRLRDSPQGMAVCEQRGLRANLRYTRDHLRRAVKIKGIFTLTLGHTLDQIAFWGISLWMPTFLVMARGFTRDELTWAAALPYLGYLAGLYIGSTLSDRTGRRSLVTGSFCLGAAAVMLMLTQVHGRYETLATLGGLFFFLALVGPNVATLLQSCCSTKLTCSATGVVNGVSNGLGALGPVLVGSIFAATGSYDSTLPVMAVLLVLSGTIILRFKTREAAVCPLDAVTPR